MGLVVERRHFYLHIREGKRGSHIVVRCYTRQEGDGEADSVVDILLEDAAS